MSREIITSGNELCAIAAVDCGCRFFGGYPITPSSEIAHKMSVLLPQVGGKFIQMEDEIAGISVALGASMSGVKAMTASSGPGISLKSEQIGFGFIAEIPLVIVDVMRGGPSTGLPTRVSQGDISQSKNPTHGDYASIALCPESLEEVYALTVRAFNLAEKYMTPVFLLLDETIGHMYTKATIPDLSDVKKNTYNRKEFSGDPIKYNPYESQHNEPAILNPFFKGYKYHITGLHHGPSGFPTEDANICQQNINRLINKINLNVNDLVEYEEYLVDDADILLISYGSVARSTKEAILKLRQQNIKVGLFRPKTIWPSPSKKLLELSSKFEKILVIELNMGQYSLEIERVIKKDFYTLFKANGRTITPQEIIQKIKEIM